MTKISLSILCDNGGHCDRCRSDHAWRQSTAEFYDFPGDTVDFVCPRDKPWIAPPPSPPLPTPHPRSKPKRRNAAHQAAHAIASIASTQILRRHRTTDEQYNARLAVCKNCPDGHAQYKVDKSDSRSLHTCGSMLKSLRDKNLKTCGCVLSLKARDKREDCPCGHWPPHTD